MLRTVSAARRWVTRLRDFASADADVIYSRCVEHSLDDSSTLRLLNRRPSVTWVAVRRQMERPTNRALASACCSERTRSRFDDARDEFETLQGLHESAAMAAGPKWRVVCVAFVLVVITMLYLGGLLAVFVGAAASAAVLGVLAWRGQNTWLSLMRSLLAGWQYALLARSRVRLGVAAARWGEELQDRGTKPVAARLIQALLGEDPDSLLLPENFDGLRSPRDRGFIVESTPARLLQRKLAQIDAGTIAVCGPRGAGKTTLLESCVEEAEFGILAQAPATYAPHDFLLSLSVQLCETYIEKHGYEVPEFTRLSNTRRLLRRLRARTRRLLRWSVFAVPACLALLLSLNASLQFLRSKPIPDKVFEARNNLAEAYQFAESVWQRGPPALRWLSPLSARHGGKCGTQRGCMA